MHMYLEYLEYSTYSTYSTLSIASSGSGRGPFSFVRLAGSYLPPSIHPRATSADHHHTLQPMPARIDYSEEAAFLITDGARRSSHGRMSRVCDTKEARGWLGARVRAREGLYWEASSDALYTGATDDQDGVSGHLPIDVLQVFWPAGLGCSR